jgi:maltose alpha-D-glucosyltransferase/alpha-amylase
MMKIMRHWLDMGAAGFRVDMALSVGNAYWADVRAMLERDYPGAALVSEASNPISSIPSGFHMDFLAHFGTPVFPPLIRHGNWPANSEGEPFFSRRGRGDAEAPFREYLRHLAGTQGKGHMCLQTSNHDMTRLSWDRTREEMELAFAFFLTMPGVPFVYYGDEIGMRYLPGLPSKEGGYNRTGSRTPMQWTRGRNAGFSSGPARSLYLPVDPAPDRPNVADQEDDPGSLLNAVRRLTALRHATPALRADGAFRLLHLEKNAYPLVYERQLGKERVIVALNPSGKAATATFTAGPSLKQGARLLAGRGATIMVEAGRASVKMAGVSYGIFACGAERA